MGAALSRKWKLKQFSIGVPVLRSSKLEWFEIGDLKKSGRQRQGGLRLKNEFLPLIRISKMAPCVYVSYGATPQLQHTVLKKRWVPVSVRFDASCGDFTLLFCRRLGNVQSLKRGCQHPSNKFEILWQVAQNSFSLLLSCFVAQYVLIIVV